MNILDSASAGNHPGIQQGINLGAFVVSMQLEPRSKPCTLGLSEKPRRSRLSQERQLDTGFSSTL